MSAITTPYHPISLGLPVGQCLGNVVHGLWAQDEDKMAHTQEVNDPNIGTPLLVTTSPVLGDKGEFIGSVHIAKDISKRKEAENLILDKNRQLQDTSQKLCYAKKDLEKKNEALERARNQLESRVAERTSELSQANELLQKEITERKHIADALQASEANLRKIIVEHPDGIVVVDREGTVRFVNPATGSLFGRKTEELMGETFGFPTVSGEASDVEVIHKTEGAIMAEMRVVEIEWEGQPALLASLHDITKRKKAEEKVQEAMEMKSEFMSVASHELRTPLTAMKEAVRLVAEEQTGKLNDEQKEFLDIAKRNVDRLARLVTDILDFQKLEAGKVEFDIRENDVNEVAKEIYAAMTPAAKNVGLDFFLDLEEDMPGVKFDRDKITQVLINLVGNALKFTERGNITITTSEGENVIQVSVSDTGPGIKAEDLPKVFREFEQLQKGGDRKVGGTGLGLAISKEIIEQHRGKICVESEYGKGTTFHFILPIWERRWYDKLAL